MDDDGGVLGNLPRSRPGQRSSKRAPASHGPANKTAAKPRAKAVRKPTPPVREEPASTGGNPVEKVVGAVSSVASGGARAATGVAREVLRRLPRP
jgi:hypothetical protein